MEPYKDKSLACLVLGIVSAGISVTLGWSGYFPLIGLACGIIGLVFGVQIRKAAQAEGFEVSSNAKAGFVLSIIGVALNALFFVACGLLIGASFGILGQLIGRLMY